MNHKRAALLVGLLALLALAVLLLPGANATTFPGPDGTPSKYRGQDSVGAGVGNPIPTPNDAPLAGEPGTEDVYDAADEPLDENTWSTCKSLGFSFTYYGVSYDCVWVNSVGLLKLGNSGDAAPSVDAAHIDPEALGTDPATAGMIAPFWVHTLGADCVKLPTDGIYSKPGSATSTPPKEFIIEFRNIPLQDESTASGTACANGNVVNNPNPQYITWQARLWPMTMPDLRQGAIDFALYDVKAAPPTGCGQDISCAAAVGIANGAGNDGISYVVGTSTTGSPPATTPAQFSYNDRHVRLWPNHAPTYALVSPPPINEDTASFTNIVMQSSPDIDGDAVACTVLAPPPPGTGSLSGPYAPVSGSCTRTFLPVGNYCNSAGPPIDVSYTAVDALGASPPAPPSEGHVAIVVTCVNDVPTASAGSSVPPVPVGQNKLVPNWASNISPGPPDEAGQAIVFELLPGIPAGAFNAGPDLTPGGTLQFNGAIAGTYVACFRQRDLGPAPGPGLPPHINVNPTNLCVAIEIQALGPGGSMCSPLGPDFSVGSNSPYVGQTLSFTDQSQGDVTTHRWEFGDGYTSNSGTPTHVYGAPADYTVRMTVYDAAGCSAYVTKLLHVVNAPEGPATTEPDDTLIIGSDGEVQPPTVEAGPDQEVREGSPVRFGAVAKGARLDQVQYTWRQTSGAPVILRYPTTATPEFDAPRLADPDQPAYLIFGVRVSTPHGESIEDLIQVTVTASNHRPLANAGVDAEVARGGTTLLSSKSVDPDSDSLSYLWGVASGPAIAELPSNSSYLRITIPADATATYVDIQLTVSDAVSSSSDTVRIWIREPPTPGPGGFRSTPLKDGSVRFDAGTIATEYVWDFGDGSPSLRTKDTSVLHRYPESKTYNVTLSLGGSAQPVTQAVTATVPEGQAYTPVSNDAPGWDLVVALVSALGAAMLVGGLLSWSLRQRKA